MTLAEYDASWAALTAVWHALQRSIDTPESAAALRGMFAALRALGRFAAVRGGESVKSDVGMEERGYAVLESLRERDCLTADDISALREVSLLRQRMNSFADYSEEEDRARVNVVTRCLPALWRAVNLLQGDLRRERPRAFYFRRLRRGVHFACMGAAVWIAIEWLVIGMGLMNPEGWRVTYYRRPDFKRPRAVRSERALAQDYGLSAPAFLIRRDGWSARWEGQLIVPEDGTYSFVGQAIDGYRVTLNNEVLLDAWNPRNWRASVRKAEVALKAGAYPIVVEHVNREGPAEIRLRWKGGPIQSVTAEGPPYIRKPTRDRR